jgi:hypothetical protein
VYGHGSALHVHRSLSSGVDPNSSVEPSANVTALPLNARAAGSFAGQPEIVICVPGFSRSL